MDIAGNRSGCIKARHNFDYRADTLEKLKNAEERALAATKLEAFPIQLYEVRRTVKPTPPVGVCVEGIRVEFQSPGFPGRTGLLAIADCRGNDAPKTNVARSALESETDQSNIASAAFELYLDQVRNEVKRLQEEEGFTLAYSIEQFPFIAGPLYSHTDI